MKNTNQQAGLWKIGFGELGATLKALQDNGVTAEHLARLRAEPDYAMRVAEAMLQDGLVGSIHRTLVRSILGKNFFGVEEWSSLYGVNLSIKQLRGITRFPWSEDVLNAPCPFYKGKSVKETHFAFLGLDAFKGKPLTILKWQELHPDSGQPKFYSYAPDNWYAKEKFGNEPTCGFRWYLMPLEILPDSADKTYQEQVAMFDKIYQEQVAMLPADYEVPHAIEEVTKVILYYRKNGICLNPTRYGRCQDVASDGRRVHVGSFDMGVLDVGDCSDGGHSCGVGVAASRKF